jgi:hypothetical protein
MHSFMTSVLLRTPRLNALANDPHLHLGVGDRERIAARAITRGEVPL